MNHNISQFREIIEDCIEGEPVTHRQQTKLEAVLEILPEEDTENVKAYQSLMFLVDYLEDRDYDEPDQFADPDPIHQLLRLRPEIEDDAIGDITDRLVVEEDDGRPFSSVNTKTLKDPVSKGHQRISNAGAVGGQDVVKHHLAHSILEAPL